MSVGNIIAWIVVGAIAGWLASVVMGTRRGQSLLEDIVVGIIGAFIGGVIMDALDVEVAAGDFNLASIIVAFIGAVVLLLIIRAVRGSAQV